MDASLATSTDFYAGANQPASNAPYMWAPLTVLGLGIVVLVVVLGFIISAEQRELADTDRSFFD